MKPEHFIREFGVEKAREVIEGAPDGHKGYNDVINQYTRGVWFSRDVMLSDLKRLVESVDRVNEHGGYLAAKELLSFLIVHQGAFGKSAVSDETINSLKAAIRDHESIYGGGDD
ncbi:hypothetical protein [Acinetobacter nosocomialis]|uniref:hypothetical protein n=1 Tax=Acinetobacter nosocomialis TaxID=106654 RepID=UPI001C0E437D|nr:hypothetical protein [Acinetobacter nosocomialis]MBU3138448.1 hypothetical protein [Acinetobacter nosocomialis]